MSKIDDFLGHSYLTGSEVESIGRRLLLLLWLGRSKGILGRLLGHTECIKWILTRWALLRLISLHTHSHASHHIHLLLLLASHRHSLVHHRLEAAHHGLEATCSRLLLLLLIWVHHLAKWVWTRQVLSLELVSLSWLLLSLTSRLLGVELIQDRHFVVLRHLINCRGQRLTTGCKNVCKRVTSWLLLRPSCSICRENIQQVVSDRLSCLGLCLRLLSWRIASKIEELIRRLAFHILFHVVFMICSIKVKLLSGIARGSITLSCTWVSGYCGKVTSINHFEKAKVFVHFELFRWVIWLSIGLWHTLLLLCETVEGVAIEVDVLNRIQIFFTLSLLKLFSVHTRT